MKKISSVIVGVIAILMCAVYVAFAYPTSTGVVTDVPAVGVWKNILSANQVKGAMCQIGGNRFVYCLNNSGSPAFQTEPAFLRIASADGYTVTTYESTTYYTLLLGPWYCSQYGDLTITNGSYGWVQIAGVGNMNVSGEGTAIAVGDVLAGSSTPSVLTTDASVRAWAKRDHAIRTSSTSTATYEVNVLNFPKAMGTRTDAAGQGSIPVLLSPSVI